MGQVIGFGWIYKAIWRMSQAHLERRVEIINWMKNSVKRSNHLFLILQRMNIHDDYDIFNESHKNEKYGSHHPYVKSHYIRNVDFGIDLSLLSYQCKQWCDNYHYLSIHVEKSMRCFTEKWWNEILLPSQDNPSQEPRNQRMPLKRVARLDRKFWSDNSWIFGKV